MVILEGSLSVALNVALAVSGTSHMYMLRLYLL